MLPSGDIKSKLVKSSETPVLDVSLKPQLNQKPLVYNRLGIRA